MLRLEITLKAKAVNYWIDRYVFRLSIYFNLKHIQHECNKMIKYVHTNSHNTYINFLSNLSLLSRIVGY